MKTVFITGAAAGIGLTTARRFAEEGYFVGLYDINQQGIEALLISGEFAHACGGFCDVSQGDSIAAALADFASETGGRLDVLVNNAGVLSSGDFADVDPVKHDLMIDINVKGFTHLAQLAHPYLKQTENAVMVNLCSASSIHGVPLLAVYSATKFYVNGLTEALSLEWQADDIRVVSVKPPFVKTAMVDGMPEQLMKFLTVDLVPEDVANAIWKASQTNGSSQVLGVKAKLWQQLDKHLPDRVRHKLMSKLTGY
ncbi:MAG: SDR family oxidoreductase [Candidatus Pelagadaptatus aseana]|uniref:SDR family oxidoreductase n=1 Tax=Candidatus Pelagadaptatus aseana TaxID=3120508 RepID=UPI0039B1BA6D